MHQYRCKRVTEFPESSFVLCNCGRRSSLARELWQEKTDKVIANVLPSLRTFTDPTPLSLGRPRIESSNTAWYAYGSFQGERYILSVSFFFWPVKMCGYSSQWENGGVIVECKYYGW